MNLVLPDKWPQQTSVKALYGGTFDPPHYGHLHPLLNTADLLKLTQIELLPAHVPVFKDRALSIEHRLAMTQLLAELDPRLSVNTIELERNQASFTIDTLIQLKQQKPEQALVFIIGSDSLRNIHKWHQWQRLFDYCHIVVMLRPEELQNDVQKDIQLENANSLPNNNDLALNLYDFRTTSLLFDDLVSSEMDEASRTYLSSKLALADVDKHNSRNIRCMNNAFTDIIQASAVGKLWLVNNQQLAVSSTFVRMQLKHNKNVERWVPQNILNYINNHQLYQ